MTAPSNLPASEPAQTDTEQPSGKEGFWDKLLGFFIDNKLVVAIMVVALVVAGLMTAPFRWDLGDLPRDPTPVDAIPDIGENQQIVFTKWPGRSPRDVEDQINYPLTTALLGIPGVRTVRSFSMFGFSSIYVIFEEGVEFYWSRSRILEKLASLPSGTLPDGVAPALGPDATALGQVFWYTLEGRDPQGRPAGGFSLEELRSIQDWTVRYALQAAVGVSEVASVGGYVREYQVDVNPEALLAHDVGIDHVAHAVRSANLDVGARTIEINRAEYVIRGLGFIRNTADLEAVVITSRKHTPIRIRDVAKVHLGPAQRRGALDVEGAPAVGGVVVARFGANPMEAIEKVKQKIAEIAPGLPQRTLDNGTVSKLTIVPFYDRSGLINETLGTLSTALLQQILITIIVVLVMLRNLRSSLLISSVLPLGILGAFVAMRYSGVDANIMALSGIAIAIGTMVDMSIVFTENIVEHLRRAPPGSKRSAVVRRAAAEVAPAVLTSTTTTIVGFLPIFGLTAAEGKLFGPLAFTKTFAMAAALLIAMLVLPALAHLVLRREPEPKETLALGRALIRPERWVDWALLLLGLTIAVRSHLALGLIICSLSLARLSTPLLSEKHKQLPNHFAVVVAVVVFVVALADYWLPLGPGRAALANRLFVAVLIAALLGSFTLFLHVYPKLLRWSLNNKALTLVGSGLIVVCGFTAWRGFDALFSWLPETARKLPPVARMAEAMPGFGREYMPPFDEGSFLYMPTTMPHASFGQALEQLKQLDSAIASVPEVDTAVGKLGRADSPLDPAPISMFETVVNYKSEYKLSANGRRGTYRYDDANNAFARDATGKLIEDPDGRPFRQWRDHIRSSRDIWKELQKVAKIPGVTSAPELMPIAARIVMLQSGMRAPMGMKIRGPDLQTIEEVGMKIEALLKKVPGVRPDTVVADRIVGKPYLEIAIDREAIARHGISIKKVQDVIQIALGGRTLTRTVEGRERYPVRVRYMRERRDTVEQIKRVLVPSPLGHQLPLEQLARLRYARGPQVIKSEDTFLTGYVVFDKDEDKAEVDVVEAAQALLDEKIASGQLQLPDGVSYVFAGSYQNQLRSEKRLAVLFPTALILIFLLIYFQFRSVSTTLIIFSGVLLAIGGGFLLIWLYGRPWFMGFSPADIDFRTLFQVRNINMSVAVWVGFIALVGIATDNGVVLATYLHQRFAGTPPTSIDDVRQRTIEAGVRRARPCLMASATTILALLPVITSTGKGADVMLPMALPSMGGMTVALITLFLVPVLFAMVEERKMRQLLTSNEALSAS